MQIVAAINFVDDSSLIFVMAVGPALISLATMFIIRPLTDHFKQSTPSDDDSGFNFIYGVSVLLAAYLLSILLLQNMLDLDHESVTLLAIVLIVLMSLPILVPIVIVFFLEPKRSSSVDDHEQESEAWFLIDEPSMDVATASMDMHGEEDDDETRVNATHVDEDDDGDHKPSETSVGVSSMNWSRGNTIIRSEANKFVEGIKKMMKKKNGRRIGEEFSIREAVVNGELWIMFLSLSMSGGSGLTVINNIGQMCQSLGDNNVNVYVSLLSICSALGRVAGGYSSELIVRKFGHSRLVALVVLQGMMALGLSYYAMGLVGQIYVVAITIGFGYGAHWSISIAAASELFGLKNFGTIFNFLAMSCPGGTLILSGFVASTIYDYYAAQQQRNDDEELLLVCEGNICFSLTCWILAIVCIVAAVLNMILVCRTKMLYAQIYRKSIII
ncbi:hypothetical protein PIB30_015819 [Stylosanthes scabra]|uniref:Nodulin-like domain-containing protein n=1 Tax=Stylosanthes scabra TaxID=79078 RepID=A0ABU6Q725_9FABA|nr:hypothetical protein [Stylosanthes scabra]